MKRAVASCAVVALAAVALAGCAPQARPVNVNVAACRTMATAVKKWEAHPPVPGNSLSQSAFAESTALLHIDVEGTAPAAKGRVGLAMRALDSDWPGPSGLYQPATVEAVFSKKLEDLYSACSAVGVWLPNS